MTKISVIVATYCSGEGLDRVVASLDAQTLPQSEFESVFVDDGSPDDTLDRLHALAEERPNMRVASIENSGWPSRPRNVGIEMATGEYVTFMDHDDELYPDALAVAYQFAREHRADVVNTKECVTHGWFWGFETVREDVVPGPDRNPELLMPMRPHKLYRRELLMQHGIRFREGRRVIYEDVYFNLEVLARATRVGVLASQPFYKWVNTGKNNSGTYGADATEALQAFAQMFDLIYGLDLDDRQRDRLVLHTYQLRILNMMLGRNLVGRDRAWVEEASHKAPALVEKYVPEHIDSRLKGRMRPRAYLLRLGRLDLLPQLAALDVGVGAQLAADRVAWSPEGSLELGGSATWHAPGEVDFAVEERRGRLLRRLPDGLRDVLPDNVVDLTEEIARAGATLTVKARQDSSDWVLPTRSTVTTAAGTAGRFVRVRVDTEAALDEAVFGRPLASGVWEVACRFELAGHVSHRAVRYDGPMRAALVDGRVMVAGAEKKGRLLVDLGGSRHSFFAATRPVVRETRARRTGLLASRLSVPVSGAVVAGRSRLPVRIRLEPTAGSEPVDVEGWLLGDASGARLECVVRLPPGSYRLLVVEPREDRPGGRVWHTPLVVTSSRARRLTVRRAKAPAGHKRVWGRGAPPGPR